MLIFFIYPFKLKYIFLLNKMDVISNKLGEIKVYLEKSNKQAAEEIFNTIKFAKSDEFYILLETYKILGTETLKFICLKGININAKNPDNQTILHFVIPFNNIDFIKSVIFCDAFIDSTTNDGNTPLHLACVYGKIDAIEILLKNKANPNIINNYNKKAIELYLENHRNNSNTIKVLSLFTDAGFIYSHNMVFADEVSNYINQRLSEYDYKRIKQEYEQIYFNSLKFEIKDLKRKLGEE